MHAFITIRLALPLLFAGIACITPPFAAVAFGQPPIVAVSQQPPWQEALDRSRKLPAFREVCFVPFDTAKALPQADDLRQWFDVVAGQPQGIFETKTRLGECAGIEGIVRLRAAWPEGGLLRLALEQYDRLQVHFFRGDRGVTLVYHEDDPSRWTAYQTGRQPHGVTPSRWALAGTDDHRNRRTHPKNHGHYALWCQDGEVVLSRGDIELVRAPLGGAPDDVFFQGRATFHGIGLVRAGDFPAALRRSSNGRSIRPADVTWRKELDEQAKLEEDADGGISLIVSDRARQRSWSATPLPRDRVAELVLEIADAAPGAGIYLGNGTDGPRNVLRYVTDRRSKQMCLLVRGDDDLDEHEFRGLHESPLPVVSSSHWLKFVFGAGQLRWSISPDGIHWAEPNEPIRNISPEVTHIGLHGVVRQSGTRVTLRRMLVRELASLSALAPAGVRSQAVARNNVTSVNAWLTEVTEVTPPGCDTNRWRRACAIKTIAAGSSHVLGNELLWRLLDDPITRDLPLEQQLGLLDDAALLMDLWDDQVALQRLMRRFVESGQAAWQRSGSAPFTAIRRAWMTTPVATRLPLDLASEELLRTEFVQGVEGRQWQRLREFSRELRFFQLQSKAPLLDWAESLALRKWPVAESASLLVGKQKEEWREMLVEELNKDVYNALAQLRVELSGASREDAARAVASMGADLSRGVAPDGRDETLLVSLPVAVREIVRNDPELRRVLKKDYEEIAQLRLRRATDRQDTDAMTMLGWQFSPTAAAVDAHVWLGDRALGRGWFPESAAAYRLASSLASTTQAAGIVTKLQLAATLAGQDAGALPSGVVAIGESQQSPDAFKKLLQDLAERGSEDGGVQYLDVGLTPPSRATSQPAACRVLRRARLDGPIGNDPNREFARDTARRQLDWVGRQLSVAVEGTRMYVSNRFQVAAYDLEGKQRIWQTPQPTGQIQFSQESPFVPSRLSLTRDRIWVRLLYGSGATLAAVDRANGQLIWTATPGSNAEFISDPFFFCGELSCVKLVRTEQQDAVVRLATLDPETGYLWSERELVRVRDFWRRRRCCQVTMLDDGLVVLLGGVLLRLDSGGNIAWLRKQTTVPPDEDSHWARQWFQPVVAIGQQLVVTYPGGGSLECLERDTGRVVWTQFKVDPVRLVAILGRQLIVQSTSGLTAVRVDDGQITWTLPLEGLTAGITASQDGEIVAVQSLPTNPARSRFLPRLVWIDSVSGAVRAITELNDLADADPRIGPLLIDRERIWTFWGRGQNDPTREVVELIPDREAAAPGSITAPDIWRQHLDRRLMDAAAQRFPRWQLLHAESGGSATGLLPFVQGEKDVLATRCGESGPVVFGREVSVPVQGRRSFRLRFGNDPAQAWQLEARFRGEIVWSQQFSADTHPQPWKDLEISLEQRAGQKGWLTIHALAKNTGDGLALWKLLELDF